MGQCCAERRLTRRLCCVLSAQALDTPTVVSAVLTDSTFEDCAVQGLSSQARGRAREGPAPLLAALPLRLHLALV